jgi:hypothetical protein
MKYKRPWPNIKIEWIVAAPWNYQTGIVRKGNPAFPELANRNYRSFREAWIRLYPRL